MSATREQVEALFAAALEQPPERRVAYVAAVVEDPDVSAEVLALLAAHERRGRFDSVAHELRGLRSAAASVPLAQLVGWLRTVLVGRYSIERELGHGGMALVYLAHDLKHDRPVAIKVLRPELAAAVGAERFLREIQIAARLQHPNILPLYDSGEAGGTLYYVMPYVEGETLRERLTREGQLPLDDALKIAAEICDALEYAHGRDLVHRDVKPENILLARERCLVADFGIARAITAAGGEKLTETGIAVGTPAYMSPEQAAAEGRVDGRSDIYSLACVLYEMLAGEPPFSGPSAHAILARKLSDPVPRLRTVRETVSAGVERAIQKALAKVPADRFTTAAQFAEALGPSVVRRPRASSPRPWVGPRPRRSWSPYSPF
ncbi:MAG TPA: serine/threonine-protein kinase [Gemmatimonadales bacterium]|nr:serine/threonine-protein kinase [Gemmatimonadales bacterium]